MGIGDGHHNGTRISRAAAAPLAFPTQPSSFRDALLVKRRDNGVGLHALVG